MRAHDSSANILMFIIFLEKAAIEEVNSGKSLMKPSPFWMRRTNTKLSIIWDIILDHSTYLLSVFFSLI